MKIRVLNNGKVNHNGTVLETYEVYDLPEEHATKLIKSGAVELVDQKKSARAEPITGEPVTPKFDKSKGYVAAAQPQRPLKPGEVDNTPVVEKTNKEVLPPTKTEIYDGDKKLTLEEAKALENKSGIAPAKPTAQDISKAPIVK